MNEILMKIRKLIGKIMRKFSYHFQTSTDNSFPAPVSEETFEEESSESEELIELKEAQSRYASFDQDHVWAFIAGNASQDFRGNPKYLFVYINRYRPDIATYWLCSDEDTIAQVRDLGFIAYKLETPAAQYVIDHTGVLVEEQVKYEIPEGFDDVKYLNLWHGIGFKHIERKMLSGDISMQLAKKYVLSGTFYRDHQLMVATSPTFVEEFAEDCGVDEDKFVRTGYLRCEYQQNFEPVYTYDHDLRKVKGLPSTTKLVVYAPTYRSNLGSTFVQALPDLEKLYHCCERNDLLLIFKVHPYMEDEVGFHQAWDIYGDRPRFWFWDNRDDFYEIIDQIDLAIIDYSSIFSDFVAAGVPHYIRYIYDFEEYLTENMTHEGEYFNRTIGLICHSFDELLAGIDTYKERDDSAEFQRIMDKLWSYAGGKDDFEKTIQQVMDFHVEVREFPTLYSFDVFDTLISRKVLDPMGIFAMVQDRMEEHGGFPMEVVKNYPQVRHSAEQNVREFYRKTTDMRKSERVEITYNEIFQRIADVYGLSGEQTELLSHWELEEELNNVVPLTEQIDLVKQLKSQGETVVLICDMYLPKDTVEKMLRKADPVLADLPLFLSSDCGVQKTSQKLFFEVYKSFEPFYDFKKWIHYGDTLNADIDSARRFKISGHQVQKPQFNEIQTKMVESLGTGDAYLVAAMQARMCSKAFYEKDKLVISYIALTLVPYVDWVLRDATRRGYSTLYFISRDGFHLKRIADAIIRVRGLDFKTKYIYASRRTWRIPSYIDKVDEDFWLVQGNFSDISSKKKLLKAMDLNEETFHRFFPTIDLDTFDFEDKKSFRGICEMFRDSKEYNDYLLKTAAKERPLVEEYLQQELDFDEPFVFVEYYGRGYSQDCLARLLGDIEGEEIKVPFYYMRTVLPTMGNTIRHHFTTNATAPYFMEGIFANMPYKSIDEYRKQEDGTIVPVINPIKYDEELYNSMIRLLPEFASQYVTLELRYPEATDRLLHEFAFNYFLDNRSNPDFAEQFGALKDSVSMYGDKREFAPPYTEKNLEQFANGELDRGDMRLTTNITMSVTRSNEEVREKYFELYQILPGDNVAGGRVLSEEEQESNRKYKQKYEELLKEADIYKNAYDEAAQLTSVRNKALIILPGKSYGTSGLDLVEEKLREKGEMEVATISVKKLKDSPEKIAKELATAKYVIVFHPVEQFCNIQFRPETKEVMLNNQPFSLTNRGLSVSYFLKWHSKYVQQASKNDIYELQIPSEHVEERYRREFSHESKTDCSLRGCCNTDIYFRENASEEARKKLVALFPEAEGKKIILYMPKARRRKSCCGWLSILNLEVLQKLIGNEYVVVVNFNTSQLGGDYYNTIEIPGFSKMLNKGMPLRQMMLVADVIVGDYRDTFYESALLHKPVYFTAGDFEEVLKERNFAMADEIDSCFFGPIVNTAQELTEQLCHCDSYDYSAMEQFREEKLADCDGHSVERVVEYLCAN